MENSEPHKSIRGTHPLLTMLLFGVIIASFVAAGSYVSKQRSAVREIMTSDIESNSGPTITFLETSR